MASPLDRFKKHLIGSSSKYVDFTGVIEPSGELKKLVNLDVILNSWYNILRTPVRSHLSDPEFGTNLHRIVFETTTANTAEFIKDEIIHKLGKYDDRALVSDVKVVFFSNMKGFNVIITGKYQDEEKDLKVNFTESMYRNFEE